MGNRTSLYPVHVRAGAKMVDFGGWDMPLHYGSQIREHQQVREHAGMFDVSHMTVIDLSGSDAGTFLRYLLANDVANLKQTGDALYSVMLNHRGGVVDDLIVYATGVQNYRLVVNGATREKDLAWMAAEARSFVVSVTERPDLAIIAVQGPTAMAALDEALINADLLASTSTATEGDILEALDRLLPFHSMELGEENIRTHAGPWLIARTGYSGEDGVEVILPHTDAEPVWHALCASGVEPAGLGARDTLRLEAGLNLYGREMDEETSPLEANLAWTIAWQSEDRDFIGRQALSAQLKNGLDYKLAGLLMSEKGVLRAGQVVRVDGSKKRGFVTSGSFSPTLQCGIALARIPLEAFSKASSGRARVCVEIRGKQVPVELVKPPFVRRGKKVYARYNDEGSDGK